MAKIGKKVEEANPNQQRMGEEQRLEYLGSMMKNKNGRAGESVEPAYRAPNRANRTARPGSVPQYTGNKSAQKLRG